MNQTVDMSYKEKTEMYRMVDKDRLIEMLIESNNLNTLLLKKPSGLDLAKLERQLDEALAKETPESLKAWLYSQRQGNIEVVSVTPESDFYKDPFMLIEPIFPDMNARIVTSDKKQFILAHTHIEHQGCFITVKTTKPIADCDSCNVIPAMIAVFSEFYYFKMQKEVCSHQVSQ